ncbi:MAG: YjjI family glycine radical enzyme [Erysipelotrichaceae bacterium]|nr:YjjI family glycine radical enzyme [Erysipelotrichaceae bacterium]MCI9313264.1 YjjI family glycine radical enzyme [Erysipelotrichaceae bacterium]
MSEVSKILKDPKLTYAQQVLALAHLAENQDDTLALEPEFEQALAERTLCDLGEGRAPYRPRYILPDYTKLMREGCQFLELTPPQDIWEATNTLLIFYKHVPSVTSFPVYLGNFSELFAPFHKDKEETYKALKLFLQHIDKTLTDSFVHANIGPCDSEVNRIILTLTKEMQLAIPNITLLYDPNQTSDEFALACIDCMLATSKPSFANDVMYRKEMSDYAIASCYNALKVCGGGYTLPRMRLYNVACKANSVADFFERVLPYYTQLLLRNMDERIRYIVEESNFFTSNFLVTEGFVKRENFTGMFGIVGLAECVNHLLGIQNPECGYGHHEDAAKLGTRVMDAIAEMVNAHHGLYCEGCGNRYVLHAQVGIDSDGRDNSPGARIPIGAEPQLPDHILWECNFHKYFVSGIGDIFKFDDTWNHTQVALLDIIKGAFASGMRYFTGYNADNDVVRVTGYLVKKSEIARLDQNQASLNNVTVFGQGARNSGKALDRRIYDESAHQ